MIKNYSIFETRPNFDKEILKYFSLNRLRAVVSLAERLRKSIDDLNLEHKTVLVNLFGQSVVKLI